MKYSLKRATLTAAASTLLAGGLTLLPAVNTRAADKYDTDLERRVETLERELNIMEGDKKGKNVEETEVPTFLKAGNKSVRELVITGEAVFRYEYSTAQTNTAATANTEGQTSRERFRLRLFADYKLSDNLYAGVAVQTALGADGAFSTFSEGFDNYSLYLWRVFVGWKPNDNITLVIGKMASDFYANTELVQDVDVSPTGLFQQFKLPISPTLTITLNTAEYIFYDNNENAERDTLNGTVTAANPTGQIAGPKGGNNNTDAYLLTGQVLATIKPSNNLSARIAGGFLTYADNGGTGSPTATTVGVTPTVTGANFAGGGNANGQAGNVLQSGAAFNSANGTRNLFLGTLNSDITFGTNNFKIKIYEDAVYNFRGGARDSEEYNLPGLDSTVDKIGFAAGFTIGSDVALKKTGDYLFLAEYRQAGLGSTDPNLNDSNFNGSRLGFRGFKLSAAYAFRPFLTLTGTFYASANLGDEKNVNLGVDNFNSSRTFFLDLTTKF